MKKIYVIFHLDGSLTLVEQTSDQRLFTPLDSLGQLNNHLSALDADCPAENIITETHQSRWQQQLAALTGKEAA